MGKKLQCCTIMYLNGDVRDVKWLHHGFEGVCAHDTIPLEDALWGAKPSFEEATCDGELPDAWPTRKVQMTLTLEYLD